MTLALLLALQDVDALLRKLGDEDARVRDEAMVELQQLEPGSLDVDRKIEAASPGAEPEVGVRARRILLYRRLARVVGDLDVALGQLMSDDQGKRLATIEALKRHGKNANPILLPLLEDGDWNVRFAALRHLVLFPSEDCGEPVCIALQPDIKGPEDWRSNCLRVLAKVGHPRGKELAQAVIAGERAGRNVNPGRTPDPVPPEQDATLVIAAIEAAGLYRDESLLAPLADLFVGGGTNVKVAIVRTTSEWPEGRRVLQPRVLDALGQTDAAWVSGTGAALSRFDLTARKTEIRRLLESPELVTSTCLLVARMKDEGSIPQLLAHVKYGTFYQGCPEAWALGQIGHAMAVPSLIEIWKLKPSAASGTRHSSRPGILAALGRIGDERAIPVLLAALEDPQEEVRYAAAEALGQMGVVAAVPAVVARLDDLVGFRLYDDNPAGYEIAKAPQHVRSDATVRDAAIGALERIAGRSFEGTPDEKASRWKEWAAKETPK